MIKPKSKAERTRVQESCTAVLKGLLQPGDRVGWSALAATCSAASSR